MCLSLSLYIYIYIHTYLATYIYIYILCICIYTCVYTYIYIYIYILCICIYTCVYIYIYIYIYLYICCRASGRHMLQASLPSNASEGRMLRSETLIELNFINSSCSSLSSCRNHTNTVPCRVTRVDGISVSSTLPPSGCSHPAAAPARGNLLRLNHK